MHVNLLRNLPFDTAGSSDVVDDRPLTESGWTTTLVTEDAKGITEQKPKVATPKQMTIVRTKVDLMLLTDMLFSYENRSEWRADSQIQRFLNTFDSTGLFTYAISQ
jgi:hypothetical protein